MSHDRSSAGGASKRAVTHDPSALRMTPIGDVVETVAGRLLDHPAGRAHRLWPAWHRAVGAQIAHHTEPVRLEDGVLTVRVNASVWKTELSMRKPELILNLNSALQDQTQNRPTTESDQQPEGAETEEATDAIRDLRFRQGTLRREKVALAREDKSPLPALPEATEQQRQRARNLVEKIEDDDLKEVLYRYILKAQILYPRPDSLSREDKQ